MIKSNSGNGRGLVFRRMLSIHLLLCVSSILLLGSLLVSQLFRVTNRIDSLREADIATNCITAVNHLADFSESAVTQIENSEWMYYDLFIQHVLTGDRLKLETREDIMKQLSLMAQQRTDVESISFWFYGKPDELFTSSGIYEDIATLQSLYPENIRYFTFPLGGEKEGFCSITHAGKTYLAYRVKFRDNYETTYKGEACILFKTEKLQRNLWNAADQLACGLSIADADGNELWSCTLHETDESIESVETISGGYRYILRLPQSVHKLTRNQIMPMIVWGILAVFVAGTLLSFVFAKIVYKPFGEMYRAFVDHPMSNDDEIERLAETMSSISRSRAQALSAQQLLMPFGQLSILHGILTGSFQDSEETMRACGLEFTHPLFNVLLFKTPGKEPFDSMAKESRAACEQVYSESARAYFLFDKGHGFYLINAETEDAIQQAAEKIAEALNGTVSHFAMGETQSRTDMVVHATDQAIQALNYSILNACPEVITHYAKVGTQTAFTYYFPFSYQTQLSEMILNGDAEGAKRVSSYIISMNMRNGRGSQRTLSMLSNDLRSTVLRCSIELGVNLNDEETEIENFTELEKRVHTFIDALTAQNAAETETEFGGEAGEMLKYIEDNLFDPMLSLDYVAQHFGKSAAYVSTTFKRVRGMNYMDYINRRRIEQAVVLLTEKKMSVRETCEAVGYTSATTFRRNFTKYTGKSPADYTH